jgi:hypothetical protein
VLERRPASYASFAASHGYVMISVPPPARSFALLPPRAAAQLTRATGEDGRPWREVEAERVAGRGSFAWIMFAGTSRTSVVGRSGHQESSMRSSARSSSSPPR